MKRLLAIIALCALAITPLLAYSIEGGAGIGFGYSVRRGRDNTGKVTDKSQVSGIMLREHVDMLLLDVSDSMFQFGVCTKIAAILGGPESYTDYTDDPVVTVKGQEANPNAIIAILGLAKFNAKGIDLDVRLGVGLSTAGFAIEIGAGYGFAENVAATLTFDLSTARERGTTIEIAAGASYKFK